MKKFSFVFVSVMAMMISACDKPAEKTTTTVPATAADKAAVEPTAVPTDLGSAPAHEAPAVPATPSQPEAPASAPVAR